MESYVAILGLKTTSESFLALDIVDEVGRGVRFLSELAYMKNIKEPFISVPVPTATHDVAEDSK